MATTALPRPSRPSIGPPTTALPAIPNKKRSVTGIIPTAANLQAAAALGSSKSGLRAPSSLDTLSSRTPAKISAAKATSQTPPPPPKGSLAGVNGAGKTLRKTISINAFPQPPSGGNPARQSSLPTTPGRAARQAPQDSSDSSPPRGDPKALRKIYKSTASLNHTYTAGGPASTLANGGGNGRALPTTPGARGSEGLLSLPSPPGSRSSSAQESYSTSATTFEESGDAMKARDSRGTANRTSLGSESKGNVLVSVRVRPDAKAEQGRAVGDWVVDCRKSLVAFRGKEGGDYYYDNVFATNDNNDKVYDLSAKRLVRRVMDGYHGTVFAYGMTGTGKTFSMQGTDKQPGVIPRAITDIFAYVRETPDREFLLRVSYLEIYNEKIFDLLAGPTQPEDIKLREDSKGRVYAVPLKEEIVQTPTSLLRVISVGDKNRKTSSTQFNSRSSRSHAVVQIVVESRLRNTSGGPAENKRSGLVPGGVRVSTLSLIDLAGSERAADSKERRTEGSHINKSLLTLGTVIARLSGDKDKDGKPTDKDGKHLPYRDSKLTRLLQSALSGEALVSILCTVQLGSASSAAGSTHVNETLNTLKFASRAKNNIVSHAKKHEEPSNADDGTLLERYRKEIALLKSKLEEANSKKMYDVEDEIEREKEAEIRHEEQLLEMQLARTALKERIDHLQRLVITSKSAGVNSSMSYSSLGMHPRLSSILSNSHMSQISPRSSLSPSTIGPDRLSVARSSSINSHSTIGPQARHSTERISLEEETLDDIDGNASLIAQNQSLQADLAEKNRYISKLEQRLLQARRTSNSRTSGGFAGSKILSGEEHTVSDMLKEKDAEIEELRSRLDDKDRMLNALRSAARCREAAEKHHHHHAIELPLSPAASEAFRRSTTLSMRSSTLSGAGDPHSARPDSRSPTLGDERMLALLSPKEPPPPPTPAADDMSQILDEMIQDRVDAGMITKSIRGTVRVVGEKRGAAGRRSLSPTLEEKSDVPEAMAGGDDHADFI